ncbi:MAG: phage holin [Bacillota bacterium]
MMANKWRNHGLWVALVSALILAAQSIGALFGFEITDDLASKIMVATNSLLAVLVVLGVVSNPANGRGFKDEE